MESIQAIRKAEVMPIFSGFEVVRTTMAARCFKHPLGGVQLAMMIAKISATQVAQNNVYCGSKS
jgi:hypothetical protein